VEDQNYVFKMKEANFAKPKLSKGKKICRIVVLAIVAIIIIGSLLARENLFNEMPIMERVCLICAVVFFFFDFSDKEIYTPVEMRFFDNYFVVYQVNSPDVNLGDKLSINEIKYSDLRIFKIVKNTHQLEIYGRNMRVTDYKYKPDGTLPDMPTKERILDEGAVIIRMLIEDDKGNESKFITDIGKIKSEIEKHSPISVVLVENWRDPKNWMEKR